MSTRSARQSVPRSAAPRAPEAPAAPRTCLAYTALLAATLVLSACSLTYELVAARGLALLAANTVVWFSVTVGLFLLGMGLGAHRSRAEADDTDPWWRLFHVELALSATGAAIVPVAHFAHTLHLYLTVHELPGGPAVFFGPAFALAVLVGFLTGIELPLLMRLARDLTGRDETRSTVLGVDYVGALVGGLLFPLVLLPAMSLLAVGAAVALVNLAVAALLLIVRSSPREPRFAPRLVTVGTLGILFAWGAVDAPRFEQYFLRKYYYYAHASRSLSSLFAPMDRYPEIRRVRSPYQLIDLVRVPRDPSFQLLLAQSTKFDEQPDYPRDFTLFLNGDFQLNTSFDEVYHEWFAHVPLMTRDELPREVLLLGGGDGLLLRELLEYDEVERVVHVDIDPELPRFARTDPILRAANGGAFDDPRVERVTADAFQWVRDGGERFPAIFADFPMAVDYDLARLYSREFFHFLRRRLTPGGFAAFDATGISHLAPPGTEHAGRIAADNVWPRYYHTLKAAGFRHIEPYLTTLCDDQPELLAAIRKAGVEVEGDPAYRIAWQAAETEEERETLLASAIELVAQQHVYSLEQGFVMMSDTPLEPVWRERGATLHALREECLERSFRIDFPKPDRVDPSQVNSVFRPTLPYVDLWRPRIPQ